MEKFFPLAVDKFITLHPNSKYDSKCYSLFQDVVDIIQPILAKQGISIVQIGTAQDRPLRGCYSAFGQTNLGQAAYILSHAILHLGVDSFATHIASSYGKKIVCLYSNTYPTVAGPYWSKPEDVILLEPPRKGKPSFSAEENPKSINKIKPETIADSVFKLLGIDAAAPHSTLTIGEAYQNLMVESVPNQVINPAQFGMESLIVRMDFLFNEGALAEQLKQGPCAIVTDQPISLNLIQAFKPRIKEIVYFIKKENDLNFVKAIMRANITHFLVSELQGIDLEEVKFKYLDAPMVHPKGIINLSEVNKLKALNKPLFYKSNKITLSDGKIYPSRAAWEAGLPIDFFEAVCPVIDNDTFWKELENFKILSTRD